MQMASAIKASKAIKARTQHKPAGRVPADAAILLAIMQQVDDAPLQELATYDPRYHVAHNALVAAGLTKGRMAGPNPMSEPPIKDEDVRLRAEALWDERLSHAASLLWYLVSTRNYGTIAALEATEPRLDAIAKELVRNGRIAPYMGKFGVQAMFDLGFWHMLNTANLRRIAYWSPEDIAEILEGMRELGCSEDEIARAEREMTRAEV